MGTARLGVFPGRRFESCPSHGWSKAPAIGRKGGGVNGPVEVHPKVGRLSALYRTPICVPTPPKTENCESVCIDVSLYVRRRCACNAILGKVSHIHQPKREGLFRRFPSRRGAPVETTPGALSFVR